MKSKEANKNNTKFQWNKDLFLGKKIKKIDKLLEEISKRWEGEIQINKITNEKENITTNTEKIQGITRTNFKNLYSYILKILKKMHNFLDTGHLPMLYQDQINNSNWPATSS